MNEKMIFEIKNLGPINEARIDLNKINVIVGKNSTGKSISSKFLYSILTAMSSEASILANRSIKKICYKFFENWNNNFDLSFEIIMEFINLFNDKNQFEFNDFRNEMGKIIKKSDFQKKDECLAQFIRINELFDKNKDKLFKYQNAFNYLLESEFNNSIYKEEANINFLGSIKQEKFNQEISLKNDNEITKINKNFFKCFNFSNILYIDSIHLLDLGKEFPYHLESLSQKLEDNVGEMYDAEFYNGEKDFKKRVNKLIGGEFFYVPKEGFMFRKDDFEIPMKVTSSGLKQIGVIQVLLENYQLIKNSFLIIDEPEVNLHPEFQVKFAEILVLMAKELDITLYINTHSPFLAEAMEVYSTYYEINDEINFYLTHETNVKGKFNFELVDTFDIYDVYDNLGSPFNIINKIRLKNDL